MDTNNINMNNDIPKPSSFSGQALIIPVAIIIGFGLIAAAIFFSRTDTSNSAPSAKTTSGETTKATLNPIDENDHILGNPNAPIMIVEYSDFDCPFCKQFHETLNEIMDQYGTGGQVAWVYRHMPLQSLHPSAAHIALASECVAKQGGNDAFWKFADLVFGERGINEQTNVARLGEFATTAGVDKTEFENCLNNQETKDEVEEDFANAVGMGAKGTPYSILLIGDQQLLINGAQPYEVVKQMIESAMKGI